MTNNQRFDIGGKIVIVENIPCTSNGFTVSYTRDVAKRLRAGVQSTIAKMTKKGATVVNFEDFPE